MKTSFDKCTACRGTGNVLGKRKFADASRKYGIQSCHAEFCPKCSGKTGRRINTGDLLEAFGGNTTPTIGNLKNSLHELVSE